MSNFIDWDYLKSLTGVSTATGLIIQMIKTWIPIHTQILAYIVATILLISVEIFKDGNFKNIPLCFINGFVASSLASNTVSLANVLIK